ncbi:hypothetical protein BC832DRAFT_562269 [Gaertneriomyces semiglobifer]|nr:hypothetical protein BC832DRAFT_562269 [Gaertneriomyces semiglobifer]
MDELLALLNGPGEEGAGQPEDREQRRLRRESVRAEPDSQQTAEEDDDDDLLSDDEGWAEIKTWDPETLMGDETDQAKLMALSELDREAILAERKSKFEQMTERLAVKKMLRRRMGGQAKHKLPSADDRNRPAKRQATEKTKFSDSISNLRKQRERKNARAREEGEIGEDRDERRRHRSHSRSASLSDADEYDGPRRRKSVSPHSKPRAELPSYSEIRSIQVTRTEIKEWVFRPSFDKTVKGCFVRYGLGPDPQDPSRSVYRLCLVEDVRQTSRVYIIEGKPVHKVGLLKHGMAQREYSFAKVSNGPITQQEYRRWADTMKAERVPDLPPNHVDNKLRDLKNAREHVMTNEEVAQIIEQKRAIQKVPVNIAAEIAETTRRLEYAQDINNAEEIRKAKEKLEKLQSLIPKPKALDRISKTSTPDPSNSPVRSSTPEPRILLNGAAHMNGFHKPASGKWAQITNEWDKQFAFDPILDDIVPL